MATLKTPTAAAVAKPAPEPLARSVVLALVAIAIALVWGTVAYLQTTQQVCLCLFSCE